MNEFWMAIGKRTNDYTSEHREVFRYYFEKCKDELETKSYSLLDYNTVLREVGLDIRVFDQCLHDLERDGFIMRLVGSCFYLTYPGLYSFPMVKNR